MSDEFEKLRIELNDRSSETCVIGGELLGEIGVHPTQLALAAYRWVAETFEAHDLKDRSIALRNRVFSYSPKTE